MWLYIFFVVTETQKEQHWPATALFTFTQSHSGLMSPKQESAIDLSVIYNCE